MDKKRKGEKLHFVFLSSIGKAVVKEVSIKKLEIMTNEFF